ncbi:hypothetical protein GYMLUDRAFT_77319 [Collybiopsis luxurians FD-317 M1]|uniref:Uncharacterized protein n=1 Tax=Collybiopsis luxurians FD-317 M1 TaxID=944289 RepID=A0A0D0BW86_9AGAR|nr:hypothetical protein GYMLUDRAFT_77319 [Collybiopsis luxurians FD-317 M1]
MGIDQAPLHPNDNQFAHPPPPQGADELAPESAEHYTAYRVVYGFDVNFFEFKAWAAEQVE